MKHKKRNIILCVCLAAVFLLCGCDRVEINVYEQEADDFWYFRIDVSMPVRLVSELEESASPNADTNKPWTVEKWLCAYFDVLAEDYGIVCEADGVYLNDTGRQRQYRFYVDVSKTSARDDLTDTLRLSGETDVKTNLFIRTVRVTRDDRFNAWVNAFEDALVRYESNEPQPSDSTTAMGILLFGCGSYVRDENGGEEPVYREEVPALFDAFPRLHYYKDEYTEVMLRNMWYASQRMKVKADAVATPTDDSRGRYYIFEKSVGSGDTRVEYEYYRADPTGWYLVALAAGLLTVGIAVLVARRQKKRKEKKPDRQDAFPYDPFAEYLGGGTGTGGKDDNNSFEGY